MRKINVLLAAVAFLTVSVAFGQTTSDKWLIGVGAHAVDYTSVRGVFDGFFDTDDYSIVPPLSKLTVARSLNQSFAVDLEASIGQIDDKRIGIDDEFYILAGLGLRYKFANNYILKEDYWFDPYLRLGANYHKYDYTSFSTPYTDANGDMLDEPVDPQENNFVMNGGVGINFWLSKNFGINVESNYNWLPAFEQDYFNHFQHSVSAVFRFGNKDKDGDGILDENDACPEVFGLAECNGCPDTDGDGICDNEDKCPEVAGPAENMGCPWVDTDGDGLLDDVDACPNEAGPKENKGCPWGDSDGDGLLDNVDQCPNEPCPNGEEGTDYYCQNGCKKSKDEAVKNIIDEINVFFKVNFDLNSAKIKAESIPLIKDKATKIQKAQELYPNLVLYVDGHTDVTGSAAYNKNLSQKRAAAVVKELYNQGVKQGSLDPRGMGEEQPLCQEATKECYEKCRRVEVSVKAK